MIPGATYIDERRKSTWRSTDSRNGRRQREGGAPPSPALGPMPTSPVAEKKKGLLGTKLFSKRRASNPQPPASYPGAAAAAAPTPPQPTAEAIGRGVDILQSIFRKWDRSALQMMLEANAYVMEETITTILNMEQVEAESNSKRDANMADSNGQYPVKNLLPDDFLRLPDEDDTRSEDGREEDDEGTGDESASMLLEDELRPRVIDTEDLESKSSCVAPSEDATEDQSEKSGAFAEDDGTLYGKEFGSDDEGLQEDVVPPVFDSETIRKSNQIVSDSMAKKFLPEEMREEPEERRSVISTSNTGVIKRSKLDLTEAEKRIRHREPHLVFELLSKASEIYRRGVISSQELDTLRASIVSTIQPSKMIIDTNMNMNKVITDHEWHGLILKAKGIRQALSVRLVKNAHRLNRLTGHVEYVIRVVDVETGVVWFTRKRFKELYKLYRKLCRLSERVSDCPFPARRSHRISAIDLASDRAPVLEAFLRVAAALVTPSPLTFLHGVALKQLQQFLEVPHEGILLRNRTQPISRELRVFVYHTVNDHTSPEGKACAKFLTKLRMNGVDPGNNLLDEIATILDGVQEYMLEQRFDEMRASVERMMKVYAAHEDGSGRRNSYVNLLSDDTMTSNDKVQQLISDSIRHELEERLCVPLMSTIVSYLRMRVMHKEQQFHQRIFQLRGKPQSYFGIPVEKISVSSWRTVIDMIKEIDDAFLPLDKMRKLVAAAHQIHTLYRAEHRLHREEQQRSTAQKIRLSISEAGVVDASSAPGKGAQAAESSAKPPAEQETAADEDVLSGDDFLPIFIYVIVHSELAAPIMTQVLLNRLCDPEKRRSESGYYLATFEAALHHILSNEGFEDA